jgi:hypothetical protein
LFLRDCWRRGFGGALLSNAAFVNFPSIYDRFTWGGDAEAHAVAPDGNDGDADITANDDLLTYFAGQYKHASLRVEKKLRMASPLATPSY